MATATPTVRQAEVITSLFLEGHGLDFVCERGATGVVPWSRATVLDVVRRQGWQLDGSGRVPRSQRPTPPRRAVRPARPLPPVLEAVAQYDAPAPAKVAAAAAVMPPAITARPSAPPAPDPEPAVAAPPAAEKVMPEALAQFLAARTRPASDEEFLTSTELRDAYEAWRVTASPPAMSSRSFGIALTTRYRKKQSAKVINGTKPICYYGIAWQPTEGDEETPTEGTAPGTIGADAAGTAPDSSEPGQGDAGPDAQPQVSPSRSHLSEDGGGLGASEAPAEPPATVTDPVLASPDSSGDSVDVLAAGLAHSHPAVRAKAKRVQMAVDELLTALARHRDTGGAPC